MKKKLKEVIELGIIEENPLAGVEMIALVESPAIETDFMAFKKEEEFIEPNPCWPGYEAIGTKMKDGKEVPNCVPIKNSKLDPEKYMFVEPNSGEREGEFISRCMSVVTGEGYEQDQALAICYSYWDEKMEVDTAGLPQYIDETGKKPATKAKDLDAPDPDWDFSEFEAEVLKKAVEFGIPIEMASEATQEEANQLRQLIETDPTRLNPGEYEIRYRYFKNPTMNAGSAERGFCKAMMYMNRYYTREEINSMSANGANGQFAERGTDAYDIFQFRGGSYCKHFWKAYMYYKPFDGSRQVVFEAPGFDGPVQPIPRLNFSSVFSELKLQSEEKRIVVGPAMIPNIEIARVDEETKDIYYVKFSEETVLETMKKFMKEARNRETNQDHIAEKGAGSYVYESWIVEDPERDKANLQYGFKVPKGTWMVSMQIEDGEVWKRVKNGELRGFSIEGNFADMEEIQAAKKYLKIMKILKS